MECIALVCQALLDPGDEVAVEEPTYLGALMAFAGAEARICRSRWTRTGCLVDALAERLAAGLRPKFVYTIPEYQNPSGRTLPLERRRALVDLCRRHGVLIFEDVAYRELSFDGDIAADAVVAGARRRACRRGRSRRPSSPACGSAGRPARRDVVAELAAAKQNTDQCAGGLGQRLVEEYGRAGRSSATCRRRASCTRRTGRRSSAALERHMPDGRHLDRADRRVPDVAHAAGGRRHRRPARGGARGRRRVRAGHAVLRRRRRRSAARLSFSQLTEPDFDAAAERLGGVVRGALAGERAGRV